ncbi:sigma-70 family RNA polymerase sigma factor [Aetokthonos hydrillicola Thurmond2011]|uniref:Sigma-70 family RNA polymerase sigma factor n=1 Tax=Aetokthonos hydrillicola Thurmond2011 TaxID=2712845 RepID=A0AAP5MEH5_9CYAN|nr:sigma-70 family RNA polymerase sigma factor [Aetokthonos hydrillicola]MDR9900979.1 sigma-70 family RNA polymerase sigma factor [Aetokthonos hydrillicola Thurmond2011]
MGQETTQSSTDPATPQDVDADLAARIARGDRLAENALVARYSRAVKLLLSRRVSSPELVHDLTQDTFIIAFARLRGDGLYEPSRLAGFLRQTAINLANSEARKTARRRTDSDEGELEAAIDDSLGPFERIEEQDLQRLVRQLIDEMPVERDRELLWRYYVLGEDKVACAAHFEMSLEYFDRALHRARSRLRHLVDKHLVGGGRQESR